ncbi:MAG: hypothetical protein JNJ54_06480 [Myxococcaceae bacterium]|nr:hypothetical protein [Myxococcaceae bacterium]
MGMLTLGLAGSALAQPRPSAQACVASYEKTQNARREGKLLEARDAALACSADACPAALSADCIRWSEELRALVPGLVFDVRLPDGSSLTDVTVELDGVVVTKKLDGKAVDVNPGPHTVVIRAAGYSEVTTRVVALEGDRTRKVAAVVAKPGATPGPFDAPVATHRPVPLITWITGGVALATLATASIIAGVGLSERTRLESCSPTCPVERAASVARLLALADGLFIGSALMAGLAVVSWFVRPEVPVWISVVPSGGAHVAVTGRLP